MREKLRLTRRVEDGTYLGVDFRHTAISNGACYIEIVTALTRKGGLCMVLRKGLSGVGARK